MTDQRYAEPADYSRLGVPVGAPAAEVKAAFRRLALAHHPDRNPGDPTAARRFHLIVESYNAITLAGLAPAPATPRPGVRAAPPRAAERPVARPAPRAPRPRPPASPIPVAALAATDVGWVAPDAILVSPDRTCFLDPAALAYPHRTGRASVRVERRREGYHVTLPREVRHRWAVSPRASAVGLRLATLGIGDTGSGIVGRNPLLPSYLLSGRIGTMVEGERGWTVASALVVEPSGRCWIDGNESLSGEPTITNSVRIECYATGLYAVADGTPEAWARRELHPSPHHIELAGAVLGGVAVHRRAGAGHR